MPTTGCLGPAEEQVGGDGRVVEVDRECPRKRPTEEYSTYSDRGSASGMAARSEVRVLTQSPDRGNLTPKRQLRRPGAPGRKVAVWMAIGASREPNRRSGAGKPWSGRWEQRRQPTPARGRGVEAIGARPSRTKAKRRKALWVGEPAPSGEARYLLGTHRVVATGWPRDLAFLPAAFCRVPRKR